MNTECSEYLFEMQPLETEKKNGKSGKKEKKKKRVEAKFDGGDISSDGGGILLRELEERLGIVKQFSQCFIDYRERERIDHEVEHLLAQRLYGLALGYEDVCDHERLRVDPLLAVIVGKKDPKGEDRPRERDQGKPLAGKSTLNRLELTPKDADANSRYKKIVAQGDRIEEFFVDIFLKLKEKAPEWLVLDVDATDDPLHGKQEGRFFHGYYKEYCYMPLYIFCGDHLLCAKLRQANGDAAAGTKEEMERIVKRIRRQWPKVNILIRGDSGFCREDIMSWCESNKVHYLLGLAKNERLLKQLEGEMLAAKHLYENNKTQEKACCSTRVFADFHYRTRKTWSCSRRVIGKAEHLDKGSNPRFIVTSLAGDEFPACWLYESGYCARGEMENRIKEQQLWMFADRTSSSVMRANQLRLWFSSVAYVLMNAFREFALAGTEMEKAQCGTIRTKMLKIGTMVRISVRRIRLFFASAFPYQDIFAQAYENIQKIPLRC